MSPEAGPWAEAVAVAPIRAASSLNGVWPRGCYDRLRGGTLPMFPRLEAAHAAGAPI
jgi:hypothetical protein